MFDEDNTDNKLILITLDSRCLRDSFRQCSVTTPDTPAADPDQKISLRWTAVVDSIWIRCLPTFSLRLASLDPFSIYYY